MKAQAKLHYSPSVILGAVVIALIAMALGWELVVSLLRTLGGRSFSEY